MAATAGVDDVEFVKSLGADRVINYQDESFEETITGFDAVFDTVGGPTLERSVQVLKKGGVVVSMMGKPSPESLEKFTVQSVDQGMNTDADHLKRLSTWIEGGKVKVKVDRLFPLAQVCEAFDLLENGNFQGKVVLEIKK